MNSFILSVIAVWLELKEILALSLVCKELANKINENTFWKNLLIQKAHIPAEVLNDPLWGMETKIFRRIYIQIAKYRKIDFFALPIDKPFSCTPILLAAFSGSKDLLVQLFQKHEGRTNSKQMMSALYYAAMSDSIDLFEWLLQKIEINNITEDANLLLAAAIGGNLDIIKRVVSLEIYDLNSYDNQDRNAIFLATLSKNFAAVKFLLSFKNIYIPGMSSITKMNALHHAAENGSEEIFFLLVSTEEFRLEDIDCFERNVLHHAYRSGNQRIIDYLEKQTKGKLSKPDRFHLLPKDYFNRPKMTPFNRVGYWKVKNGTPNSTKESRALSLEMVAAKK